MLFKPGSLIYRSGEVTCYLAGIVLTGFFAVQLAQGEVQRQEGIDAFEQHSNADGQHQDDHDGVTSSASLDLSGTDDPDTSLWNAGRIDDYKASLQADLPAVYGVLEVPSVNLKVPVYATNTDLVMDRGAGIIDGMAYPHEPGNIGISGHRDGYFRVLKDVKIGDSITLQTLEGAKHFRIDDITIVPIADTTLLRDTDEQSVTLVTCYPFYFVGHAPKRYIVTASLDSTYVTQK